ncbi:hypothetical protein KCP73_11910 [Salmonella enterica subsp. enterica]|nr:hypothetical protein KCP73_11910 [Salmonella enterica subsp. enterica]
MVPEADSITLSARRSHRQENATAGLGARGCFDIQRALNGPSTARLSSGLRQLQHRLSCAVHNAFNNDVGMNRPHAPRRFQIFIQTRKTV